jgi:hypothetical protein
VKATGAHGLALAAAVLGALAGCAERRPAVFGDDGWGPSFRGGEPAPDADGPAPAPRAQALPPGARSRWAHADELPSLAQIGGRERSEHLDGAYERTVVVNDAAAGYAHLTAGTRFPPGALVVQRHHAGDEVVAYYVMERVEAPEDDPLGGWRFSVVDPALRAAATEMSLCARCHREAPFGSLFGPPPHP